MINETSRGGSKDTILVLVMLAVIAGLTYLPLVNQLGYYRDDWHVVWAGYTQGAQAIVELHKIDRPFMGVIYSWNYRLLGTNPLNWHLYIFFMRLISIYAFYWLIRMIWQNHKREALIAALLISVYPGFLQQPTANAYSNHMLGFTSGVISLALFIYSFKHKSRFPRIILTLVSMIFGAACYFIMEYMIGLEGIRLILLWYIIRRRNGLRLKKQVLQVILYWLPFALLLTAFLFWRVFIFESARSVTDVGAIGQLYFKTPMTMVPRLVLETIKDFFETVLFAWGVPFYNMTSRASYADLFTSLIIALIGLMIFLVVWRRVKGDNIEEDITDKESNHVGKDVVLIGILSVFSMIIPVILANRDVRFEDTFDRYTLAGSFGAVLILVGLMIILLRPRAQFWITGLLLILAMMTHYNNAVYFKNFWNIQKQLWWQLTWRAPGFDAYTALVPYLPDTYRLAESYEIWGPANIIYHPEEDAPKVVGDPLNNETLFNILQKNTIGRTVRKVEFTIDWKNLLLLSMPRQGSCLHIHDGAKLEISEFEAPIVRLAAANSRIGLIIPRGEPKTPPSEIFGTEPAHNWCYYYQKASLARQNGDWDAVVSLGDEASEKGLSPNDISEWMPFYEGYALKSMFPEANYIAARLRENPNFLLNYCSQFDTETLQESPVENVQDYVLKNLCASY